MKKILLFSIISFLIYNASGQVSVDTAIPLRPAHNDHKKFLIYGGGPVTPSELKVSQQPYVDRKSDGILFRGMNTGSVSIFRTDSLTISQLQLDTLISINWDSTLTDNFISLRTGMEETPDWFDDNKWSIFVHNAKMISLAVVASKAKGIFMDTEPYFSTSPTWKYNTTLYPGLTFDSVERKVRQRGKQFIQALQTYSSDIKVLCTGLWSFPRYQCNSDTNRLDTVTYALLKSFADGMLEGVTGNAKIIDGNEQTYDFLWDSYWLTSYGSLLGIYNTVTKTDFIAADLRAKADTFLQIANATKYTDPYFSDTAVTLNQELQHQIYNALLWSDEYDWMWAKSVDSLWLKPLPSTTMNAIDSAKYRINNDLEPGFCNHGPTIWYSDDLKMQTPIQGQIFHVGDTISYSVIDTPGLNKIQYVVSYNRKLQNFNASDLYKQLAVYPGEYLVFAISNSIQKLSNPITFYVTDDCSSNGLTLARSKEQSNTADLPYPGINVYPNPTNTILNMEITDKSYPAYIKSVEMYDVQGKKVLSKTTNSIDMGIESINVNSFLPGTYLYRVQLSNGIAKDGKFVKL